MYKKIAVAVMVFALGLGTLIAFAHEASAAASRPQHMLGFSLPTYSTLRYNEQGHLKSVDGWT